MHETPEGYLVCVGVSIARTGEMIYGQGETPLEVGADGKAIVQRNSEEVFRPETIASFEGKPVTITHPPDFVEPKNWAELTKGILQNIRRGTGIAENDLVADLLITDKEAISLVKKGLREVSCGYEAEYTQLGIGRGSQSKIIGNHLALVEEGRAGSSYAINDHKGKGIEMTLAEKIKGIFGKAQDEALKAAAETKDAGASAATIPEKGFVAYDDFKAAMDKIDAFMGGKKDGGKDASTQPTQNQPAHIEAKDDESEEEKAKKAKDKEMEDKKMARDAWIDAMMAKDAEESEDDDEEEEATDEEEPGAKEGKGKNGEPKESEDDDFEESTMVGDTASRVEILAPGMKHAGKGNAKVRALLAAYATKDGKKIIEQFTGGKPLDVKNAKTIDAVFIGASEMLKVTRSQDLARTRTTDINLARAALNPKGAKTPEEINKINEEYWAKRTANK